MLTLFNSTPDMMRIITLLLKNKQREPNVLQGKYFKSCFNPACREEATQVSCRTEQQWTRTSIDKKILQ